MGDFWGDVGDNLTAFFGGSTPEKVRANRQRVQAYQSANKPLPSITKDLGNPQAMQIPGRPASPHNLTQSTLDDIVRKNTMAPGTYQSPTRQGHDDIPESTYRDGPPPPSILEELMGRLAQGYQGTDPSQIDFSSLDKALQGRLDALNGVRNQLHGNFDQSDNNLRMMHDAFQNQVNTEDAARYNQQADQFKGNIAANTQQGVSSLEAARAKANDERTAMLKNLGIEAAGAAVDPGAEVLNRGINTINERSAGANQFADTQRANNLAYNTTVAQSIGQAGVARRSALAQQLQGLLGKVDMSEADARAANETERQRQISAAQDSGYKQWNDNQNRMMELFNTLSGQELQREKMAQDTTPEAKPQGMQAIAAQLEASGADPAASQRGLAALGNILAGGNYLEGANGKDGNTPYDRASVIAQKLRGQGVDDMTASQIAIAYANL